MVLRRPYATILTVTLALACVTVNVSCRGKDAGAEAANNDSIVSQRGVNLEVIDSKNGALSYRFETPLMEEYKYATEPYMLFPKGVKVVTYNDSTRAVDSQLRADYAKRLDKSKLWEARGNVVAINNKGDKLETEQLFWDEGSDKVYSNVYSRITTPAGEVLEGTAFESKSDLTDLKFYNPVGFLLVDPESARGDQEQSGADSVAVSSDSLNVDTSVVDITKAGTPGGVDTLAQ